MYGVMTLLWNQEVVFQAQRQADHRLSLDWFCLPVHWRLSRQFPHSLHHSLERPLRIMYCEGFPTAFSPGAHCPAILVEEEPPGCRAGRRLAALPPAHQPGHPAPALGSDCLKSADLVQFLHFSMGKLWPREAQWLVQGCTAPCGRAGLDVGSGDSCATLALFSELSACSEKVSQVLF